MSEIIEQYYALLDQWMNYYGFEKLDINETAQVDKVYKRSRNELSKFGNVTAYCCVKYMKEGITGGEFGHFSEGMFELANKHRQGAPLGFGAMIVVYPLIISESISQELAEFIRQYCPKHFSAAEFPSFLDLRTRYLYYYEKTPIWGSAYYSGYRKEIYNLFSPQSWSEVASKSGKK